MSERETIIQIIRRLRDEDKISNAQTGEFPDGAIGFQEHRLGYWIEFEFDAQGAVTNMDAHI